MNFAIVSIAIGDHYQKIAEITYPTIRRYAEKIGAEFIAITEQKISDNKPDWEKFQMFELLDVYDRILYLDADIIVRKCCPNIFDIVPETHFGAFNEAPCNTKIDYGHALQYFADVYNIKDLKWDGRYYNAGVMVLSRCHRLLFRQPDRLINDFWAEQTYINLQIQHQKTPVHNLDSKFNRMKCIDSCTGTHRYESCIIHYAGMNSDLAIFANELAVIDNLPDDYKTAKRIWIFVTGGLGDEMQAEPAIRFAVEHIWPKADIRVSARFPELFAHLPVRCAAHNTPIWQGFDSEPFTRVSLPGPEGLQEKIIMNLFCHSVDYCSMAVLSRILPDIDKTIHLKVEPAALESVTAFAGRKDFSDCVLVHAGQNWESLTFPMEWWQAITDGIIEMGMTPIFIGKNNEWHAMPRLEGRDRAIDLTNKLTLTELIAIISLAPILISNDGAPVHLAGAFDNWIILIPIRKHPDFFLPYRHGTKAYKTAALYKKLALDDMQASADLTDVAGGILYGPWESYLPEVKTVLDKIKEIKNVSPQKI